MASPNTAWTDITTTTLQLRTRELADNLLNNTALLQRLNERGNVKPAPGGNVIEQELVYQGPGNFQWYCGYETLNISQQQMFTSAEFEWKQASVAVTISGLEMMQNRGRERMINLLEARISAAEKEMTNNISDGLYSNGTGSGGKQIGGLQLLVSDAGTGVVGGIDSSTWAFWQNYVYDFSAQGVAAGPATITSAMNDVWLNTKRNRDVVDLIVADNEYYDYYWQSLQAIQRIGDENKTTGAFSGSLKFKNADVVADGGLDGYAPAAHMYFLNTDYLFFRPHPERNMVPLNPERFATNQDAMVRLLGFMGNMTVSARRQQGVIVS